MTIDINDGDKIDPPLVLEYSDNCLPKEFSSLAQLKKWIDLERDPWREIINYEWQSRRPIDLLLRAVREKRNEYFRRIDYIIREREEGLRTRNGKLLDIDFNGQVSEWLKDNRTKIIFSDCPDAIKIKDISKINRMKAALKIFRLEMYADVPVDNNEIIMSMPLNLKYKDSNNKPGEFDLFQIFDQLFEMAAEERHWSADTSSVNASIEQTKSQWHSKLSELSKKYQKIISKDEAVLAEFEKSCRDFAIYARDTEIKYNEIFRKLKEDYEEKLRLDAPAKYWRTRALRQAIACLVVFLIFISSAILVGWLGFPLMEPTIEKLRGNDRQISIGAVALVSPLFIVIVYYFRMLIKVFNQNLQGSSDARHRSTLIDTYLALIKNSESGVTREERILLLQAIFRSNLGTGDDDSYSASIVEAAIKAVGDTSKHK